MNFSVGICAYNEEQNIGKLLANILNHQTRHHLAEIIVVASGCTDRTNEIVQQWTQKDPRVKLIVEAERKGKYSAVNLVLANNQSEILVMTDADCLWQDNAIDYMLPNFDKLKVGAVCGRTIPINPKNSGFWGYLAHFRYKLFDWGAVIQCHENRFCHLSGYLYAVRKEIIDKIPAIICDDAYIGIITKQKGYRVIYEPKAIVYIKHPTNLTNLYWQRKNIRLGHLQIKHLTNYRISNTIPTKIIPLVFLAMKWKPKDIFYTFIIASIEQFIALAAWLDFKRGKVPLVWKYIKSSKELDLESTKNDKNNF